MPNIDLTDDELVAVTAAARKALAEDRYPLSPRLATLKPVLAELDPGSVAKVLERPPLPEAPARSRGGRRTRRQVSRSVSVALIGFIFHLNANAQQLDYRGWSIDSFQKREVIYSDGWPRLFDIHVQIYVGKAGDIFWKETEFNTNTANMHTQNGSAAIDTAVLGKAVTESRDRMFAWTMENEGLVSLAKQIEGVIVTTYTLSVTGSTCVVTSRMEVDQATSRRVMRGRDGKTDFEVKDFGLSSSTCAAKLGNIFNGYQ